MDWGRICLNDAVFRAEQGLRQQQTAVARRESVRPCLASALSRVVALVARRGGRRGEDAPPGAGSPRGRVRISPAPPAEHGGEAMPA